MSLWTDKYRPKDLSRLDYHKQQATDLKNLTRDGDFPHLLVYGPSGAGKKTRIMCLLKEIYGSGVERLKLDTMHFTTPSGKKLEIMTVSSNYHIEVNASDAGIYDRVVVMEIIKNIAQVHQLDVHGQKEFKVIVLTDVDNLTRDAQHALRRTMEKYIATCRIILCATSVSRVIPAIRSRCLCVRVPAPTIDQITEILVSTCQKERERIPRELAEAIAEKSERNLRRALLMCEAYKVEYGSFSVACDASEKIALPDWHLFIKGIVKIMLSNDRLNAIAPLREGLYELITNGIPTDIIFKTILDELLGNSDIALIEKIVEAAAEYEHRMSRGNKQIFHLEAFALKCMTLYQSDLQELLNEDF